MLRLITSKFLFISPPQLFKNARTILNLWAIKTDGGLEFINPWFGAKTMPIITSDTYHILCVRDFLSDIKSLLLVCLY